MIKSKELKTKISHSLILSLIISLSLSLSSVYSGDRNTELPKAQGHQFLG